MGLNKHVGLLVILICSMAAPSQGQEVLNTNSVDFPLGKETRPNFVIRAQDNPDMNVQLGMRFQGTAQMTDSKNPNEGNSFDIFGRRVRFEMVTQFSPNGSFTMDLRNDNANQADSGERTFNIGDAYFVQKKLGGISALNLKLYRGKVDVSRSETAKSSWQIYYDRAAIADEAAQFVSHNRRAANVQLFGDFHNKVSYSLAIGDGVNSATFHDATGTKASSVVRQNPMMGGKIILSPFTGWEEKVRTETYFGQGQHLALGVGSFLTGNILFKPTSSANTARADRRLLNIEASGHYRAISLQAEFFRFDDVAKSHSASTLEFGSSTGWYLNGEYVFTEWSFMAPFFRYESWDRFEDDRGYHQIRRVGGINWYLRGNTLRAGLAVQSDSYGTQLGMNDQVIYKITSQLHF